MHGGAFRTPGTRSASGTHQSCLEHQQRRCHRLERESPAGRLGIWHRARRARHGFLGARTVTPPSKVSTPAAGAPTAPHVKRSGTAVRQQTNEERRRAQRVLVRIPVLVHLPGKANPLQGTTHTVSANGALIILPQGLPTGTKFN